MALSFLEKGRSQPRAIVRLVLGSGTFNFLSGAHPTIDYLPIVNSIGDVGQELDIKTRKVTYGSTDVVFMDDGELRSLIDGEPFVGQRMKIELGSVDVAEGTFQLIFNGIIKNAEPFEGGVVVSADDARSNARDRELAARDFAGSDLDYIINRHPLQIMLAILNNSVPSNLIDTASFDPDLYATGSRAMSHWNTVRAIHGTFDRRISERTSALAMLDELALLMDGTLLAGVDGKIKFKQFDPSAASVVSFQPEDIGDFEQPEMASNLVNEVELKFGWRGESTSDSDVLVKVDGVGFRAPSPNEYLFQLKKRDLDSILAHADPETGQDTIETQEYATKWVGPSSLLESELQSGGTSIVILGGWACGFSGVDRILGGVSDGSVNFGLNATERFAYLLITPPKRDLFGNSNAEIIKCDVLITDTTSVVFGAGIVDPDLVGVPNRVTYTVASGGRAQFGTTTPASFPPSSLVTDVTIPVAFVLEKLKRFVNGLPIAEFPVGLEHVDLELSDFVTLVNDVFLAQGEDGLSGVEKLEIIGKTITPIGDDAKVQLRVTPVEDPTLSNVDDVIFKPKDYGDDPVLGPQGNNDAPQWGENTIPGGVELELPGGAVIKPKRGRIWGTVGPTELNETIPTIPLIVSRDHFLAFDSHTRMFLRQDLPIGALLPKRTTDIANLWRVKSDGFGVPIDTSGDRPEDLRVTGRTIIAQDMVGGSNREVLNGALSTRLRNSDRYPPDHLEVSPVTTVWGPPAAVGNQVELDQTASSIITGDAAIKVFVLGRGVRSDLIPVDEEVEWLAEFNWTSSPAGGTAAGFIDWIAQDRRTVLASDTIFSKVAGTPGTFQSDRDIRNPPATSRFARIRFIKAASSGPPDFALLDSWSFKRVDDAFGAFRTGTQSIPGSVFTKILYNTFDTTPFIGTTKLFDFGGRFSLITSDYTAREDQQWEFEAHVQLEQAAAIRRQQISLFVNAVQIKSCENAHNENKISGVHISGRVTMAAGDVADIRFFHDSAGALDILSGANASWFQGKQVT